MGSLFTKKNIPYLIFSIIPSYIIGIAVTEVLALLLIIIFFFNKKSFHFFKINSAIILILFSFLCTLSGLINLDYNDLKLASVFHIRFALLSIAIYYFLENFLTQKKILDFNYLRFFLFLILFINIDSFKQFISGINLFGQEIINYRISGIFGDELILGSFLLFIFPITLLLILIYNFKINRNKKYLIFFFSIFLITVYISGSRAPFFLTILFVLMIIFFVKIYRNIFLNCLFILMVFIASEKYFEFGKTRVFHRVFFITFIEITDRHFVNKENINKKLETKKAEVNELDLENKFFDFLGSLKVFSKYHQNHYLLALDLFKEKPFLGNGPKGFRNHCRNINYNSPIGMCTTHPHNYFFQLLSELGIIGILFYLFFIFFVAIKLCSSFVAKKNNDNPCFSIISIGILILFFPFAPSGNFFNNWISIVNYSYVGIYLYFYQHRYTKI